MKPDLILRQQSWWEWVAEVGRTEKMELLPLCAQAQEGGLTQHSKDLCGADAEVLGAAVQGLTGEFWPWMAEQLQTLPFK